VNTGSIVLIIEVSLAPRFFIAMKSVTMGNTEAIIAIQSTMRNCSVEEGMIKVPCRRARQRYTSAAAVIIMAVAHRESTPTRTRSTITR